MENKQRIHIKIKAAPASMSSSTPAPAPTSTSTLAPTPAPTSLVEFGKTIHFSEIDKGGTKDRTWINYVNFIIRFYKTLTLPDKSLFYWEYLSKQEVIDTIVKEVLTIYHIRDGNALAAKLSPFRSMVFRMDGKESLNAVTVWGETVSNSRKNFHTILNELGIDEDTKHSGPASASAKEPVESWLHAREHLHNVSNRKSIDSRVRVLATIYKYGYIFRMSTIFRTYIHLGDSMNRDDYNFLDLDRCIWSIVDNGVQKLEFRIPKMMSKELKVLTLGSVFCKGWLVPQRRGAPYAPEASLSSFSSWTNTGMLNYRTYRKLYLEWLKADVSEEYYRRFVGILDSHVAFELITYIPPTPDQELELVDIESIEDPGQEIVSIRENTLATTNE